MAGGEPDPWSAVAEKYEAYWLPRLRPYIRAAVDAVALAPEGPIAVPGCGPGEEVILLAARHPGRSIIATDPAKGMIAILWQALRSRGISSVVATAAPAESLSSYVRRAAGVFSSFSLQLLPNPIAALADWSRCLRRGGAATVIFWPAPAPGTPHERLQAALEAETGEKRLEWETRTREALPGLGFEVERDETMAFEMEHGSPEEYFGELVDSGPLQPLLRRLGPAVLERARKTWLAGHGLARKGDRWVHSPVARLWVLRLTGGDDCHH